MYRNVHMYNYTYNCKHSYEYSFIILCMNFMLPECKPHFAELKNMSEHELI